MSSGAGDHTLLKDRRAALLDDPSLRGTALVAALASIVRASLQSLSADLPSGWALATTGSLARNELCPGSDIDLVLLHPKKVANDKVASIGNTIWYPLWDAGFTVTPSSQTVDGVLVLGENDLIVATSLLGLTHLSGDEELTRSVASKALAKWQAKAKDRLLALSDLIERRHVTAGEVAFLLEPDLKEGRGGARDLHSLDWAKKTGHEAVGNATERSDEDPNDAGQVLLAARAELHRITKRKGDRLLLQEQDGVAKALGFETADALMASVSAAGRTIAWNSDRFWWRVRRDLDRRTASRLKRPERVAPDLALQHGALVLTDDADCADPALTLRAAATAAQLQTVLGRSLLHRLAAEAPTLPSPWPEEATRSLLSLLGAGTDALPVIEALDRYDLLARMLPEWSAVRSKPQRNAYHRFTVDWHLCHAAVEATKFVRTVARPDLLLLGTWLHDIGKGFPGDHTEVGEVLIRDITTRMGFDEHDVDVLIRLCRYHLLLPETATRRDLSDPATTALVAEAVRDVDFLELLRALTEADSRATGPSAWSDWKGRLVAELVQRTALLLEGHRPAAVTGFPDEDHLRQMALVRNTNDLCIDVSESDGHEVCIVAAPDRRGLLAALAGSLSLNGVEIVSADAWTSDDGVAVDELRVARRLGGETNWRRVEADLRAALAGTLDLETKLAEKAKSYARKRSPITATPPAVEVLFDHAASETATVCEVRAPDAIGLLWRVSRVIGSLGLDIRHAKVATLGHEVVDVFYLRQPTTDGAFERLDAEASEQLRDALLNVIATPL